MNIAIDIRPLMDPVRTGVGEYTFELLQALFAKDKTNQYILFYNALSVSDRVPSWNQDNVHIIATRFPNKGVNICMALFGRPLLDRLVLKQVRKKKGINQIDYWFSPNYNFTAVSKKTAIAVTVHDLSYLHFPSFFSWKRRLWHRLVRPEKQCQDAKIIFTPSLHTKRDLIAQYKVSEEKIHVAAPGLSPLFLQEVSDVASARVQQTYNLPKKFILCVGTIEPRKNIQSLIRAYQQSDIRRKYGYQLIIAGAKGWNDAAITSEMSQTEGVRFLGYIPAEDKPALYKQATVFVYPSLYEGFGFPVLEAMAMGTPVITSNRASLPEVGGDAVQYIDPHNVASLATTMEQMVAQSQLREYYSARGKERATLFSWATTAETCLSHLTRAYEV